MIFRQILLTSSITNLWRTVGRIYIFISGLSFTDLHLEPLRIEYKHCQKEVFLNTLISFEWLQFKILFTGLNYYVQHNKQHHRKVLLSSIEFILTGTFIHRHNIKLRTTLKGHNLKFRPQTQKYEPPCIA